MFLVPPSPSMSVIFTFRTGSRLPRKLLTRLVVQLLRPAVGELWPGRRPATVSVAQRAATFSQLSLKIFKAVFRQSGIQYLRRIYSRNRNEKVASRKIHQPFDMPFLVGTPHQTEVIDICPFDLA